MTLRMLPMTRPCRENFAAMPGSHQKRFCESCNKHVHDLSAGTEDEARALFKKNRGASVCVRYAKDASGAVRFRSTALVAAAAISLAACSSPAASAVAVQDPSAVADYDMGDGVPDVQDRCPDDPSSSDIDDGCPEITQNAQSDAGK